MSSSWLLLAPYSSLTCCHDNSGPLDENLQPRPMTWANSANLLFVDNPVGTGYSYVTSSSAYCTDETCIANDLVTLLSAFLTKYPALQTGTLASVFSPALDSLNLSCFVAPFFIFSESYGGKMATSFAWALTNAIKGGSIKCNFQAVALGDSWIRPMSFVNNWGPYLYATAEVDSVGLDKINKAANATQAAVDQKQWTRATDLWSNAEDVVERVAAGVNFYNILHRSSSSSAKARALLAPLGDKLTNLMTGPIAKKLGIPSSVTYVSTWLFSMLRSL